MNDHRLIWLPVALTVLDRIITVAFWNLEGNPLLIELGVYWWLLLSSGLLLTYTTAWYAWRLWNYRSVLAVVVGYAAYVGYAVLSNAWIVLESL